MRLKQKVRKIGGFDKLKFVKAGLIISTVNANQEEREKSSNNGGIRQIRCSKNWDTTVLLSIVSLVVKFFCKVY